MLISVLEKLNCFHLIGLLAIDVKMDGSVLQEKFSFKMLGLIFSSKSEWGSYIISIAKTTSTRIVVLIHSTKLLSPEVALYLHINLA